MGDNRLRITATDKYGNTSSTELLITSEEPVLPPKESDYTHKISRKQIEDVTNMLISYARGDVKNLIEQSDV